MPYLWTDPAAGLALPPEMRLLAAVVRQALIDAQKSRGQIREEAQRFWADTETVDFWATLLDLDGTLQQRVEAVLRAAP
jgi:uncharacterized membrane protein